MEETDDLVGAGPRAGPYSDAYVDPSVLVLAMTGVGSSNSAPTTTPDHVSCPEVATGYAWPVTGTNLARLTDNRTIL